MEDKSVDHGSRISRVETDLDRLTESLEEVVKVSAATSADITNLTKQMSTMFIRANRPIEWGAMVAALGLLFIGAGLLISPMKEDINEQKVFDDKMVEHFIEHSRDTGIIETDIAWIKEMEDRLNRRLHGAIEHAGTPPNR